MPTPQDHDAGEPSARMATQADYDAPYLDTSKELFTRAEVEDLLHALDDARRQLAEHKERLALALEGSASRMWEIDAVTEAVYATQSLCDGQESPTDDMRTYMNWQAMIHPDDIARVEAERNAALAEQRRMEQEFRIVLPNGSIRWLSVRGRGIYDETGRLLRTVGISQDTTGRKAVEEALRASEAKFAMLFEMSAISMTIARAEDGVIVDANSAALQTFGYSRNEMVGHTALELNIYTDPAERAALLAALERDGSVRNWPVVLRAKDGTTSESLISATAVSIDGVPYYLSGTMDIEPLRQAEAQHERSRQKLARAHDVGQLGSWEWDIPTGHFDWSDGLYRLLGVDKEFDRTSANIESILHPEDLPLISNRINAALTAGDEVEFEFRIVRPDGAIRQMYVATEVFRDKSGAPAKLFGIVQDITARKRAEEALRRSEHNLNEAERLGNTGSFDYDIAAGRVTWSANMHELMDETESSLGEPFIVKRVHPDDRQTLSSALAAALATGGVTDTEFRIVRDDGSVRAIHVVSETLLNQRGEAIRTIGHVQDITESKQAAAERERLLAQLAQAQKMETLGRLAGGIAHDFNNMLAVMMLRIEMALNLLDAGMPLYQDLMTVYSTAQRSANLVQQLLGYARKQTIAPRIIDLNAEVESMLPMLRKLIGEEVQLAWAPATELWPVKMDVSQVDQILTNLCVNGRDAIDGVGTIFIATANVTLPATGQFGGSDAAAGAAAAGDYVTLTVTDTGEGIEPDILAHIFEPFYTTKEIGKGVGLGLATVDGIIQQNGGHIDVASRPGAGTAFTIYLPRHAVAVEPPATESTPLSKAGTGKTVLVVEDDKSVLDLVAEVLRRAGYTVLTALSPSAAIQIAGDYKGAIDLLLTDVIMPEMNGAELARRIRQERPAIRTIYMSGYPAEHVANRGVLPDEADFLGKPFSIKMLVSRVGAVLDLPA